ncbi:MAG TPA: hypothetical protein VF173_04635 [Thermoanaerobaculia bacterium]|nr:hypothetical protein [Thermoanaerobaculia bacterium]
MKNAPAAGIAILAGLLALTGAANAAKAGNPAQVVAALAAKPPQVLSELEAVVGPLHRDTAKWEDAVGPLRRLSPGPGVARVDVELAIDVFHQDPQKVQDPSLKRWDLDFLSGREASRRRLAERFPKAQELRDGGRRVLRFGDFYYSELDVEGSFRLTWYRDEPLFAIPLRSEGETAKLVNDIAAVAKAGFSRQAVTARFGALTHDPRREVDAVRSATWDLEFSPPGAAKPERFTISFERPLPSRDLLPQLGIERPAVHAGDTHLQSRTIIDLAHRMSLETGYPLPAVAGYVIDISVDPKGLVETSEHVPGSPVWSADGSQIVSFAAFLPRRE